MKRLLLALVLACGPAPEDPPEVYDAGPRRPMPLFTPAGHPYSGCPLITGQACYYDVVMRCACPPGRVHCDRPVWVEELECGSGQRCGWEESVDGIPVLGCIHG